MKKILLFMTLLSFVVVNTAFASISKVSEIGVSYKIEYPQLDNNNNNTVSRINNDIKRYVSLFKTDYNSGKFFEGTFDYKTKYEDDEYISIVICDSRVYQARYRAQDRYTGLTYNKKTGERVPLRFFVRIASDDSPTIRECQLYNWRDEEINRYDNISENIVTDNYFLNGNGKISLIYQVYQRGCYADGMTYAVLDLKTIDYLNRKNP